MSYSPLAAAAEADDDPLLSPVGQTVDQHIADGSDDPEERAEFERLAAFEQLARLVILRRGELGLSQADLARRMNTTRSVVSRIESGQHPTNTATLKRLAEALDGHAVMGFAFGPNTPLAPNTVQL